MKLALVSFACLLMHGGDISGPIAVTPASAAPAAKCGKPTCQCTQDDPFAWTAGTMTDPGASSATMMSEATAVNRALDGSGFTLDNATAINDNRQIVATGSNAQGQEHTFLLAPA